MSQLNKIECLLLFINGSLGFNSFLFKFYPCCIVITDQETTVGPTKSGSDVIFCLELLSKTQTCTLHFS